MSYFLVYDKYNKVSAVSKKMEKFLQVFDF